MQFIKLLVPFLMVIQLFSCSGNSNVSQSKDDEVIVVSSEIPSTDAADINEITLVLREMYKWYETSGNKTQDFPLTENDSLYTGIDAKSFTNRIEQLQRTNLFSSKFIADFTQIAEQIDRELKQGASLLYVGDQPTYLEANPWCSCQDNPDEYWKSINIRDIKINNDEATLNWTWDIESDYYDFEYHVSLQKENGKWVISYLQGFDKKYFF